MARKVYSYIRFSTPEQAKGHSLTRQREMADKWCIKHGYAIDESLTIKDLGISAFRGKNVERGMLGDFLLAIEEGKVERGSILLVESLDRLSRMKVRTALKLFISILDGGVDVVTLLDNEKWYKADEEKNDTQDMMMSLFVFARANEESKIKSERVAGSWKKVRTEHIKIVRCPAWLKLNKTTKQYDLIPHRVAVVKRIFELVKNGMGIDSVARLLNQEKEPTFKGGKLWRGSYVRKMIIMKQVLGEYQPQRFDGKKKITVDEPIPNYYPAIIDEATWHLCNAGRKKISGRIGFSTTNLYTGVIKCGRCGSPMSVKGSGANERFFVCENGRHGLGCTTGGWAIPHFDFCVSESMPEILNVTNDKKTNAATIAVLEGRIEEKTKQITRLNKQLTELDNPPKSTVQTLSNLEVEVESLRRDIVKMTNEDRANQSVNTDVMSELDLDDDEGRRKFRRLIQQTVEIIKVYPYGADEPNEKDMEKLREKYIEDHGKIMGHKYFMRDTNPRRSRFIHVILKNGIERYIKPEYKRIGTICNLKILQEEP